MANPMRLCCNVTIFCGNEYIHMAAQTQALVQTQPEDIHRLLTPNMSSQLNTHYIQHTHTHTHTHTINCILPDNQSIICCLTGVFPRMTPLLSLFSCVQQIPRLWTNTSHLFVLCNVKHQLSPSLLPSLSLSLSLSLPLALHCVCVL